MASELSQAERTAMEEQLGKRPVSGDLRADYERLMWAWMGGRDYGRERERALEEALEQIAAASPLRTIQWAIANAHGVLAVSQPEVLSERSDTEPGEPSAEDVLRDDAIHHMATIAGQLRLTARDGEYVEPDELKRMGDELADSCKRCRAVLQVGESNG